MLLRKRGMHLPRWGGDMPQGWEETRRSTVVERTDQYSLGSNSVVTLRSHSVMIQSFRSGASW
jgi:hypothetical protein